MIPNGDVAGPRLVVDIELRGLRLQDIKSCPSFKPVNEVLDLINKKSKQKNFVPKSSLTPKFPNFTISLKKESLRRHHEITSDPRAILERNGVMKRMCRKKGVTNNTLTH